MIRDGENGEKHGQGTLLQRLCLSHFRCFDSLDLDIPAGLTLITGENAAGKTTILEAIAYLASGKLLRTSRDRDAIQTGFSCAQVFGELDAVSTLISIQISEGSRKIASLNGMNLPKVSDLLGRLPATSITTFDLPLSQGDPASRRLFLDLELGSLYPGYLHQFAVYKRALEQRNSLLKLASHSVVRPEYFEPWEEAMAQSGAFIRQHRRTYIGQMGDFASQAYADIARGESLCVTMKPEEGGMEIPVLLEAIQEGRESDLRRGSSSIGPHRDDFLMEIEGKDVKTFGSQGQQRSCAIALKVGAFDVSRETNGAAPLLLLDDMLSDLDEHRRSALAELVIAKGRQAILTCTESSSISPAILSRASERMVIGVKVHCR